MIEKINRYEIQREIGRGAMGIVYQAYDPLLSRTVAIKILRTDVLDIDEKQEFINRFKREARTAGKLSHPNIVTIHDLGEDGENNMLYIIMEMIAGKTLFKLISEVKQLNLKAALDILSQIADGLDYAHKNGIIHRDIKPENIIITTKSIAKITDFGIAKISGVNYTQIGTVLGTPSYMSPEQFMGKEISYKSDLFSFGTLACMLLFGKKPFDGETINTIAYKIIFEHPVLPENNELCHNERLKDALYKCLSKDPSERHDRAADFVSQVRDALLIDPDGSYASEYDNTASMDSMPMQKQYILSDIPKLYTDEERQSFKPDYAGTSDFMEVNEDIHEDEDTSAAFGQNKNQGRFIGKGIIAVLIFLSLILTAYFLYNYVVQEEDMQNRADTFTEETLEEEAGQETVLIQEKQAEEDNSWLVARGINTPEGYRAYLSSYPSGKYVQEAEGHLLSFQEKEDKSWLVARGINTPEGYRAYLSSYPSGKYVQEAEGYLRNLRREEDKPVVKGNFVLIKIKISNKVESEIFISKYETAQDEFESLIGINPSYFREKNKPADSITWYDAVYFCNKKSEKDGLPMYYEINNIVRNNAGNITNANVRIIRQDGKGWRLPTAEEWEYACRAGSDSAYYFGNNSSLLEDYAWFVANSNLQTRQSGQKTPNAFGLYDMHGNVWEWCWDSPDNTNRVKRGGSYESSANALSISFISSGNNPGVPVRDTGFRIVRNK